ncbi:hypothetical protein Q7C36_012074 [Tachysurus vachellii]|uniref:protein-serine/threonine phosphatase n=1 Tax=Tachysurus vachellii TaxID=175792 RepID=A0AA88SUS8_TACVA|nr:hypothetical protein Q7C36_012074 [Tachysurus vachellii]
MAEGELNVDSLISRLLEVRGCRPGKIVQMTEAEVRGLCIKSREIFLSQPILLELEAPLKICGECDQDNINMDSLSLGDGGSQISLHALVSLTDSRPLS